MCCEASIGRNEAQNEGHVAGFEALSDVSGVPAGSPSDNGILATEETRELAGQQGAPKGAAALTHGSPGERAGKNGAVGIRPDLTTAPASTASRPGKKPGTDRSTRESE